MMKKSVKKMVIAIAAAVMMFGCTTAVFAGSGAVNIIGNSGAGTRNAAAAASATSSSSSSATSSSAVSSSSQSQTASSSTSASSATSQGYRNAGTDAEAQSSTPAGSVASYTAGTNVTTVKAANTGYGDQILPFVELFAAAFLILAGFVHLRLNQIRMERNEEYLAKKQSIQNS
jgi:cobalamin biosynthesis Mg chelatase CobN